MTPKRLVLAHLALAAALPGCFDSHGAPPGGDAGGPAPDAGACLALPGGVMELRCELRGTEGHAILSTAPTQCCSSGTPETDVRSLGTSTGTSHEITVAWTACDCCAACRCIGPIQEVDVSLGTLGPGSHTVTAGGLSCAMVVAASTCSAGPADEARMPRYLYPDQSFAATTLVSSSGGCGCSPRFDGVTPERIDLASISLCDCCDLCGCVDFGYELNVELGPLSLGEHEVVVPHGVSSVTVVSRDATHPLGAPSSLRVVSAEGGRTTSGPRIDWAVVGGSEAVCCVEPAPVVDQGVGPDGEIVLSLASATREDCDCIGRPVPFEAWLPLVDLPSGTHVVRAGTFSATVEVP